MEEELITQTEETVEEEPKEAASQEEAPTAAEEPQTEPKQNKKKRIRLAVILGLAAVALACLVIFLGIPGYNYLQADKALEAKDYDKAYTGFAALDDFFDSKEKADESLYRKANQALENGEFDLARETFDRIPSYLDAAELSLESRYRKANTLLEQESFDEADALFGSIADYRDAADLVLESRYRKAVKLREDSEFDEARQIFVDLGTYSDSEEQIKETDYRKALMRMEKMSYAEAYQMLCDLGDYSDAEEQRALCIYAWVDSILTNHSETHAERFSEAVSLQPEHYETVYNAIVEYIKKYPYDSDWLDPSYGWYPKTRTAMIDTLLEMLPTTYEETERLTELFTLLNETSLILPGVFSENLDFLRSYWDIEFVRDLLTADDWLPIFLDGRWKMDGYYLNFDYDAEDNSVTCTHNLLWITYPYGVKYFDFRIGGDYVLLDKDNQVLARVFRFTVTDIDTMEVYCYQDEKTYTFTRS